MGREGVGNSGGNRVWWGGGGGWGNSGGGQQMRGLQPLKKHPLHHKFKSPKQFELKGSKST